MTQTESALSLTFSSGLVTGVAGGLAMLVHAAPVTLKLSAVVAACGLVCVLGSLCFFAALRHTTAATVSQYHYTQLITGALLGYLLWHERPTLAMLLGATLITAAGLYTAIHPTQLITEQLSS